MYTYKRMKKNQEKIFDRGGVARRRKFSILVVALGILSSASFWRGNQVGGLPRRFTFVSSGPEAPIEPRSRIS